MLIVYQYIVKEDGGENSFCYFSLYIDHNNVYLIPEEEDYQYYCYCNYNNCSNWRQ